MSDTPPPAPRLGFMEGLFIIVFFFALMLVAVRLGFWWERPEREGLRTFLAFMLLPFFLYAVVWAFRRLWIWFGR